MKKLAALLATSGVVLTLAACSSNYVMHTNDGRTIVASGKPALDDETGLIKYKDANGVKQQINRSDIKEMVELGQ
ncbi:YgdI/YgdR family lipoprotein [Izhakiella capsodis]|uniref:YgdI/YgdR family lipoprotein n=1 Tax=Izhakiella capsodis TaxID=1367852 RepID=UPI000B82DE15|nr:YgdI/YgdR family lipoprotein [Izhakiella capsodis]